MKRQNKFAVAGVAGAMLVGAGAGVVINLPAGAGASSAPSATATPTTDPAATDSATPSSDAGTGDSGTTDPSGPGKGARGEFLKTQLDALVTAGTITQAQEDAILAGIESARPAAGDHPGRGPGMGGHGGPGMGGMGGPGIGGPGKGGHGGFGFGIGAGIDAAATALGVTADELKTELEAGKTIADIATEKNVDVQTVIDAIVAAETSELTQRVTDAVNGVRPTPPADAADPADDDTTSTTTG